MSDLVFGGAILAGGRASRCGGVQKGLLEYAGGIVLVEKIINEMAASGVEEIAIVANDKAAYEGTGRAVVGDLRPGVGPLGGIEAGLAHFAGRCDGVIFLPCDLPRITVAEISALKHGFIDAQVPVVFARTSPSDWHPLCTVVRSGLLATVAAAIDAGVRRVREVWIDAGGQGIHFPDDAVFFNINTPEDLEAWRAGFVRAI